MDNPGYGDDANRRDSSNSNSDDQDHIDQDEITAAPPKDDDDVVNNDDDITPYAEKADSFPPSYSSAPPTYNGADSIEMKERNGASPPMRVNHSLDRILSVPPEVEERRREEREREPLKYCRWIVARPRTWFLGLLFLSLFMVALTGVLLAAGYDAIPIYFEDVPLDIQDNKFLQRGMAWEFRLEEKDKIYERGSEGAPQQPERSQLYETIVFIYKKGGGNVFTTKRLKGVEKTEREFIENKKYSKEFCQVDATGNCAQARSVIRFFDGTFGTLTNDQNETFTFEDANFTQPQLFLYMASKFPETLPLLSFILPAEYTLNENETRSTLIRSAFRIGTPLHGYDTESDDEDGQEEDVEEYVREDLISDLNDVYEDKVAGMDFYYYSATILTEYASLTVLNDMTLLLGSLLFIFAFMWLQTRSLFITAFAVLSIVTSFFTANLLYRVVFDFRYFGIFHVLALFIILGIGADNVFVFYDTWRETSHYSFPSVAHRLSFVFRRATLAMLYTSLTTAIAFIVNATSPFLGVNSFGVFAGVLVLVNYLAVVIYLPTVIVTYHLHFEKYCFCCCGRSKTTPEVTDPNEPTIPVDRTSQGIFVRFFNTYFFYFVTHKIARWFILLGFALLLGFFLYQASQLEVDEDQVEFFREDNNIGAYFAEIKEFSTGDEPLRVMIMFGLEKQDLDDCHYSDPECEGDTVLDKGFFIGEKEQRALLNMCQRIWDLKDDEDMIDDLKLRIDVNTGLPEVYCFPELMREFYENQEPDRVAYDPLTGMVQRRYPEGTNLSFPIDVDKARTMMTYTNWVYNTSLESTLLSEPTMPGAIHNQSDRSFEIGLEQWLYDGYKINPDTNRSEELSFIFNEYDEFIGVAPDDGYLSTAFDEGYLNYSVRYGNKVRFVSLIVNTTIRARDLGYIDGVPIRDDWEDFVDDLIDEAVNVYGAVGLRKGFQCTPTDYDTFDLWHWLDVQQEIVLSAFIGIGVGLGCALPILIVATHNVIVGCLATLNIALVTATVLGFIPLMGWKIGILESLNLVLVVGLAVDYCVHLAEGYCRSTHKDRVSRVRDALTEVGVSVCSGCITTVGASAFMLLAVIRFFTQFGTFLFATLGFSLLYSLGFLTTVLGIIGPEDDFGSLKNVMKFLCGCIPFGKKKDSMEVTSPSNDYSRSKSQPNNVV